MDVSSIQKFNNAAVHISSFLVFVRNSTNSVVFDRARRALPNKVEMIDFLVASWEKLFSITVCCNYVKTSTPTDRKQYVIYNIGLLPSQYYKVLGDKDQESFKTLTFKALLLILTETFIKSTKIYVASVLFVTWRGNITESLHRLYFREVLYYTINVIEKSVDNPDQRITQDVKKMCDIFSQVLPQLLISPFTIGYYTYQAYLGSGYIGPVSCLVLFVIITFVNKFLMSFVVNYVFKTEKLEGDFRFKHMQIRVNAESAAFYRSGNLELDKTNKQLNSLLDTQHKLVRRQYGLNFSIFLSDYAGSILSYLAIAIPIFMGVYDHLSAPDLSALISKNAFVTIYLISCFTALIDLSTKVTEMAGTAHRVGELAEELRHILCNQEDKGQPKCEKYFTDRNGEPNLEERYLPMSTTVSNNYMEFEMPEQRHPSNTSIEKAVQVKNLTYGPPKSHSVLCKDLNFTLERGVNLLISGDSGCGKSSLLRVINGLWLPSKGSVENFISQGPKGLFYLPQKPYFTNGTLRDQITFPMKGTDNSWGTMDDEKIGRYLNMVGLSGLLERLCGLDENTEWNWYDKLSPGEMQRLSFVRLFYHHPPFAVLDESTSQVGVDAEALLYKICAQLNITVMSIGHRESVRQYHKLELHINCNGSWTLEPLPELTVIPTAHSQDMDQGILD